MYFAVGFCSGVLAFWMLYRVKILMRSMTDGLMEEYIHEEEE